MSACTAPETIKSAKNPHICSWCNERIEAGESYKRWRWFDCGDASTVKMHPECNDALNGMEPGDVNDGWYPGEFSRGCGCYSGECDCEKKVAA